MSTTQPIRQLDTVNQLKNFYLKQQPNTRNFVLITIGLNTALRISDILSLHWSDVYDFSTKRFLIHLSLTEQKTGKQSSIYMNTAMVEALHLLKDTMEIQPDLYIFRGNSNENFPLSRFQAYRIIHAAAQKIGLKETIGCHSLRKTFGYHAWKQGIPPALLMNIYNHSSYLVTKRYLGIEQDDRDQVFQNIQF